MIARLSAVLLVATLLAVASPAAAQDAPHDALPRNAAYLELLGNGLLYSVNVEHRIHRWLGRVGAGYLPRDEGDFWAVPVMVSTLWGDDDRRLETGIGVAPARHPDDEEAFLFGTITVGYRWIRPSGLLIRAGVTPFFDAKLAEAPGLWAGVSIGWTR